VTVNADRIKGNRATASIGHFGRTDLALPWEQPHAELAAALSGPTG
jgi:hypothetical protein